LAAGRGTRMGALTDDIPKPMLMVAGKSVLARILETLPQEIDEVIIVVGYLGGVIQKTFGGAYAGKRLLYVEQDVLDGTAGALWRAKDFLNDSFLVMNGDDICLAEDIRACAESPDWAILVQTVTELGSAGKVVVDAQNRVVDILEKEKHSGGPGFANTANFFKLDTRVFAYPLVLRPGSDTEYGLPQTIVQAAKDIVIHPIEAHALIRLTDPDDIAKAEAVITGK
jgi:UDP-N-acetylglucosamine diphosphorylase / glucose-1-phosphate thymidylyltransferase / UDP-N-acetylgalactosamine diphosphorylase / glucosamine-1-phosphate N-acetyltransferase / galactosamine-1-phosphate N-acetyltransferase